LSSHERNLISPGTPGFHWARPNGATIDSYHNKNNNSPSFLLSFGLAPDGSHDWLADDFMKAFDGSPTIVIPLG